MKAFFYSFADTPRASLAIAAALVFACAVLAFVLPLGAGA